MSRSPAEVAARKWLEREGWTVLDKGWPDFLVYRGLDECRALEIKRPHDRLRPEQELMHKALRLYGLPVDVGVWRMPGDPDPRVQPQEHFDDWDVR